MMNRLKIIAIFSSIMLLMSTRCIKKSDLETSILIENNLDRSVYLLSSLDYPNTQINGYFNKKVLLVNPQYYIKSKSNKYLNIYGICKKDIWKMFVPSDTLLVFVLDKDSVDVSDWEEYTSGDKYLRRYKFSYEDILRNGCKITIE
ncbi:MAG: hypothetical protein ACK5MK_09320 [Dysgonomonas sp.]